jgi:DNA-directed RNA polymerase specialized sigma24 family protein
VELHYFEGYRYEEIAARLRIPLSQVRGRLYRIRKTIHNLLPQEN